MPTKVYAVEVIYDSSWHVHTEIDSLWYDQKKAEKHRKSLAKETGVPLYNVNVKSREIK